MANFEEVRSTAKGYFSRGPHSLRLEHRYFLYCLTVSLILFLICSVFSVGSHQGDEYFQIVEFTSSKLGLTDPTELTWEYHAKMRPWLQPAIYVEVARVAELFGVHRPLSLLFLFRLVTSIAAWSSLWVLVTAGRAWVGDEAERRRLYLNAALLWLLPYLGARTSAETMSALMLCFGIAFLEWRSHLLGLTNRFGLAALGGIAFGLCFEFRYASSIMAAGAAIWYLWRGKDRFLLFAGLTIGASLALALGFFVDWWGYGHPTVPAYWYVYQNFILGRSNDFGTSPFFGYLYLPLQAAGVMAPLVVAFAIAAIIVWLTRARSVVTWATAPYIVLLSIAPHKEVRFLFPLVSFLPFFVTFAFFSRPNWHLQSRLGAGAASFVGWLSSGYRLKIGYLLNAFGLLTVLFLPQWPRAPLYQYIEDESVAVKGPLEVAVIHTLHKTPYEYINTRMAYLEPKNVQWILAPSVPELEARYSRGSRFLALIHIPVRSQEDSATWVRSRCVFVWGTFPRWLQPYNFNGWQERSYWWELYRCDAKHRGSNDQDTR